MPTLLLIAIVTIALMIGSVVAAVVAARPKDELRSLRKQGYEASHAAFDEPATARPPFDLDGFRARAGNDPAIMNALIDDFLARLPEVTQRIRIAMDLGDAPELSRCAALLRESVGGFGAEPLVRSINQLEKAAATDITLAWRAADVFDRDLDRLVTTLRRARAEPPPEA